MESDYWNSNKQTIQYYHCTGTLLIDECQLDCSLQFAAVSLQRDSAVQAVVCAGWVGSISLCQLIRLNITVKSPQCIFRIRWENLFT